MKRTIAIVLVVLSCAPVALSQTIITPFPLAASLQNGRAALSWQKPDSFAVSFYQVKRCVLHPGDTANIFEQIDTTSGTTYEDTSIAPHYGNLLLYQVWAVNNIGQFRPSKIAMVFFGPETTWSNVKISSKPVLHAIVDWLYSYQVLTSTSGTTQALKFRLLVHPESMTIDSITGLISWTPHQKGSFPVDIGVISSNLMVARQVFYVMVGRMNGTIAGKVTDTLGNPIRMTLVRLYQADSELHFNYSAVTDSNGNYTIQRVDSGKYFARAISMNPQYFPRWFNGVDSMGSATPVTVTDTTTQHVNFTLRDRFASLPRYTVTGVVKDTGGAAINGGFVVFANAGFVFNSARGSQSGWQSGDNYQDIFQNMYNDSSTAHSFDLSGTSPFIRTAHTDINGAYSVDSLLQGLYIAFVKAGNYPTVFYNNESNLLLAQAIPVNSEGSEIDFILAAYPPVPLGKISGTVKDSASGATLAARIIAYRDVWDYQDTLKMRVPPAYFTDAGSAGTYTLSNLPPGHYKILVLPLGSNAPSFYSLNGSTASWKNASAVQLNGNNVTGIDIPIIPMAPSTSGYTSIGGKVISGATSNGVSGVLVYAFSTNGNIAGYAITSSDGSFTIPGLAPGTYKVSADVMGFSSGSPQNASPSYNADGTASPSTVNLSVTPESTTGIGEIDIREMKFVLYQNFPNPFNPATAISFTLQASGKTTLKIYDMIGREVATLVNEYFEAGYYQITFNASNLASGIYFARLQSNGKQMLKKMLLVK